ncbi:MAG: SDR family oxidoreductase [Candidatus Eremiobacteraeota bacterium]|nr:SDR family oxidoreductase [Candidatus Eremiobacteraeota bacterium]
MRVFVTGATGFIGSVVVADLINAGHHVLGLSRSEARDKALLSAGAEVHRGHLEDLESLRSGAAMSEAVIHTAFIHDFSKFQENCEIDGRAIEAMGSALAGSGRPLIVTSGTGVPGPSGLATEDLDPPSALPRISEQAAMTWQARGVRVSVVRLPQVHNRDKMGLVSPLIAIAREKGVSAYVGDGLNRWPACHLMDAAPLYRLVLENGVGGARYNAVAEEGVPVRAIAEAIGRGLHIPVVAKVPAEAAEHFGPFAFFVGADLPASSALTQQRLGWRPTQSTSLLEDLDHATDFLAHVS